MTRASWASVALAIVIPVAASGQIATARGLFVSAVRDSAKRGSVLSRAEVFAAFEATTRRTTTYESSDYRLGAIVDVVHVSAATSLAVVLGTELKAAPENSIGFDPRGAIWEEELALFGRTSHATWTLAGFMRCRHDIDNGTPVEPPDVPILISARGRTLAIPGLQVGAVASEWHLTTRAAIRAGGELEGYISPSDRRTPRSDVEPDWTHARGAATATIRATFSLSPAADVFLREWESHVLFDQSGLALHRSARTEVGAHVRGPAGGMDLFFAREQTFDDGMTVDPRRAMASAFGIRLTGPSFF